MITDYSSVMFDYAILKRPMIYFTYDIDDYTNNVRSFYFDIFEEAPGPKVETNEELIELLKNFDVNAYNDEFGEKYRMSLVKSTENSMRNTISSMMEPLQKKLWN